jgi:hypothetical protein
MPIEVCLYQSIDDLRSLVNDLVCKNTRELLLDRVVVTVTLWCYGYIFAQRECFQRNQLQSVTFDKL